VFQILEITPRVVVCLNLIDEATAFGVHVDHRALEDRLGVPVVPTVARVGRGLDRLRDRIGRVATGELVPTPRVPAGALTVEPRNPGDTAAEKSYPALTQSSETFRKDDAAACSRFSAAERLVAETTDRRPTGRRELELAVDRVLTSRWLGLPAMLGMLGVVLWLTIAGANIPSALLRSMLIDDGGVAGWLATAGWASPPAFLGVSLLELLHRLADLVSAPWWLSGFLIDGVYLGLAWVVSVMLPPMAIFFPLFTLLEDLGLLPRLAFNMDRFFRAVGGHGKQALTMAMGCGCNAAGVIACRIIDSPRERLIAILTNTFVPCNGRWPTLIMMASLFLAASVPRDLATLLAVTTVAGVTVLGIAVTLLVSLLLSRTVLRGVPSSFSIELPPYRVPKIGRVLYSSLIDRTLFVLRRAVICAAPAGGLIWLLGAIPVGDGSLFGRLAATLGPAGAVLGLDGVILIAFLFAIPANEIVIPTVIMGYLHTGRMTETADPSTLFLDNGWTLLTVVCVMLFSLLHYPCTTTTLTIWAETRSPRWTVASNLLPLVIAVAACAAVTGLWRVFGL
jgi:ferrous iron transport protein B